MCVSERERYHPAADNGSVITTKHMLGLTRASSNLKYHDCI